ncbi:MAG: ABC transporter ATP-binding protein [Gordonibacter sp.]|nr:ABC transporter ATP-binding protein [Gordonibacter sp.]
MFRRTFVLTEQGMKNFVKGAVFSAIANLMLMAPVVVFYFMVNGLMAHMAEPTTPLPQMGPYVIGIIIAFALIFITQMLEYKSTYSVVYDESARKRIGLAERLRMLPLSFFGNRDLSDLTSVIMKDCADQERLFSHTVPQLFGLGASTLVFAVMLLGYNWQLGLAALWPIPIAIIALLFTGRVQKRHSAAKNQKGLILIDGIQEFLECNREIRSLNKVDRFQSELDERIDEFEHAKIGAELAAGVSVCSTQGFLRLGIASTILVGTLLLVSGQVDFITFFCYMLAITRVYDPINVVLQSIAELLDMTLSLNRMRAIEEEPIQMGATTFEPRGYDLIFDDVSFAYDNGQKVLDKVSFTAREGEVTALVGASGSGKSTVVKLAARFWDVKSGQVSIGGVNVNDVDPETLLGSYSEVFQDVVLFDNTIMENIRLGRIGASDQQVLAAARAANCDEFVRELDDGYATIIGENGNRLSGGERQRISIARAILKNAPVVLLDEATASLDVENETKVQGALSRLLEGKTVLVIAHRMRTVNNADKIAVLDQGRVVEEGHPCDLREFNGGYYARMYAAQQNSAAWTV